MADLPILDILRSYFEVEKHLLAPQSRYRELKGKDAKDYLQKARILFEELGMDRDLDELDRMGLDLQQDHLISD